MEGQLERCHDIAARLNAKVLKIFREEGKSAFYSPRPGFDEAIEYSEQELPDYFITWSTSRFSRTQSDAVVARARLDKVGVEIVYASFDAGADPDTRFLNIGLRELMDEYSSRQTSKDTLRSMVRNARDGYWNGGRCPYGYKPVKVGKHKKLEIVEAEAEVVREIFNLRFSGVGGFAIAKKLNGEGKKNRNLKWHKKSVTGILRNHAVTGSIVFGKKSRLTGKLNPRSEWTIVNSHEKIINDDVFTRAQAMMNIGITNPEGGSPNSSHIFTGLLRCGQCGGHLKIESGTGRDNKDGSKRVYYYYNCSNSQKHGDCESRRLSADLVDSSLLESINSRVFHPENMNEVFRHMTKEIKEWESDRQLRIVKLEKEIVSINQKKEKIYSILEDVAESSDPRLLLIRIEQHNENINKINDAVVLIKSEKEPEVTISPDDLQQIAGFFINIIRKSENPKKIRSFLSSVIDRIIIENETAKVCYRPDMLMHSKKCFAAEGVWLPGTGSNRQPGQ